MKSVNIFCFVFLFSLIEVSFAQEICNSVSANSEELKREILESVLRRTPVKYHKLANEIRIIIEDSNESIIPTAVFVQGVKGVIIPRKFINILCSISHATYMYLEDPQNRNYDQEARVAADCLDNGNPLSNCLIGFSDQMMDKNSIAFSSLSGEEQNVAYVLFRSSLNQVMMHEFAHHYLNHFERISKNQITRIDAEFEADYFAIINGIIAADASSSMYYFFKVLADIEHYTNRLRTPDYESAKCRTINVENVVGIMGVAPLAVLDAAFGGNFVFKRNSPELLKVDIEKYLTSPMQPLDPESCGKLSKTTLEIVHQELKQFCLRIAKDSDYLLSQPEKLDVTRTKTLLRDLSEMAVNFTYINPIVSKAISLILRRWGLRGYKFNLIIDIIDELMDNPKVVDELLSEDYGRLLQSQGLSILQEGINLPLQFRLDSSYKALSKAVDYLPTQSESWINLAMIAFKKGDCNAAAEFAKKAVTTSSPGDQLEDVKFFELVMKKYSNDPKSCMEQAANFHPYPGL